MAEPVFALTRKAQRAISELNADIRRQLDYTKFVRAPRGYFPALEASYKSLLAEIIREGMRQVDPDRMMRVKCSNCGRESQIAGDVQRWNCACSPSTERYAFLDYMEVV